MDKWRNRKGSNQSTRRGILLDDASGDLGNFHGHSKSLQDYSRDLSDKRASLREEALSSILKALTVNIEQNFVDRNFVTLVYQCLHCIKKGSPKEMKQAAHIIGLSSMITTSADKVHEAYDYVPTALSQGELKAKFNTLEILGCLAVVTFFGASNSDETEQAMKLLWDFINPDPGHSGNFILLRPTRHNNDKFVCTTACEALALIFETKCLEKISTETKDSRHEGDTSSRIHPNKELNDSIIKKLRSMIETSNESIPDQASNTGFSSTSDALNFLGDGKCLNNHVAIGGQKLTLSTWSQVIQKLNLFLLLSAATVY
ncbi:uncharacterized protein LOC120144787 [Hibiscus syriacus]|uniref:uncharacterized protein LOC120144787 n=1 Tax=Hibiscus syriacus TaxID=106335 RepID=UPI001921040E|nr:uncharacterized protein LOC120144787 [Hibiscus syriacus]